MYSQHGQDRFVVETLGRLRGGFFLDSGAADGISASNTLALEAHWGWDGLCVEPNCKLFEQLVENRNCRCVNCCLYEREGAVDFIEDAGMLGGIAREYHPSHLLFAASACSIDTDDCGFPATVAKQARLVGSVLDEQRAPPVIDYWSLDTEGSELAILRSFPFGRYAVRLITVEHNRLPVRAEIADVLERCGYVRACALAIDDCYVRPDLLPSLR